MVKDVPEGGANRKARLIFAVLCATMYVASCLFTVIGPFNTIDPMVIGRAANYLVVGLVWALTARWRLSVRERMLGENESSSVKDVGATVLLMISYVIFWGVLVLVEFMTMEIRSKRSYR